MIIQISLYGAVFSTRSYSSTTGEIIMKKVWRCSNCKQMSTRLGNLKRHFQRKHAGMGSPILQYILGNSIVTPDESTHSFQVFRDEYTLGRLYALNHQKKWQNNGANESHEVNWIDRILKLKVINSGPNFEFQSNYPSTYYSRIGRYPPNYFQGPSNYEINEINPETHKAQMRYDGVSGIKMDVCTGCLQILSAPITSKNLRFEDFHVCDPRLVDYKYGARGACKRYF